MQEKEVEKIRLYAFKLVKSILDQMADVPPVTQAEFEFHESALVVLFSIHKVATVMCWTEIYDELNSVGFPWVPIDESGDAEGDAG